ncbi:four helix bundle protein [Candidatus Falkowbacteria bacterium]|nr:four helix bundle protein [Candidatus Falkowbacteria bacterium]
MTNTETKTQYNLATRTTTFSCDVINFIKNLIRTPSNEIMIKQLIRSATSIGANYAEADGAESKKDFYHKIGICKKESKETMYWLQLVATENPLAKNAGRGLWREAHELTLIFSSIIKRK